MLVIDRVGVKLVGLVAVPPAVVTEIDPAAAPFGTVASIWVSETIVNDADKLPNVTLVAPVRFVPLIVTPAPVIPEPGENESTVGAGGTTNAHTAPVWTPSYGPPRSAV